jgi:tRNA G18 (ribose-2'-O)-methylase SpoU
MDWVYYENTIDAIKALKKEGFQVLAVEQAEDSISLQNIDKEPFTKTALVFGNEVKGVSNEAMKVVDGCVEVPQFGTKHSLNISVCLGIVVWEFFRNWKYKK